MATLGPPPDGPGPGGGGVGPGGEDGGFVGGLVLLWPGWPSILCRAAVAPRDVSCTAPFCAHPTVENRRRKRAFRILFVFIELNYFR